MTESWELQYTDTFIEEYAQFRAQLEEDSPWRCDFGRCASTLVLSPFFPVSWPLWSKQPFSAIPFHHDVSVLESVYHGPNLWNCEPKYTFPPLNSICQVFQPSNRKGEQYKCFKNEIIKIFYFYLFYVTKTEQKGHSETSLRDLPQAPGVLATPVTGNTQQSIQNQVVSWKLSLKTPWGLERELCFTVANLRLDSMIDFHCIY